MHSRLLAATNFTKLRDAAVALGLGAELDAPLTTVLEASAKREVWATTMLTAIAGRFGAKTLRDLLEDRRPEAWLFSHGRERASEVLSVIRRYLAGRATALGLDDDTTPARPRPPPPGAPCWPLTEEALTRWAKDHQVVAHLDDPLGAAVQDPRHTVRHAAFGAHGRLPLRHVLVPALLGSTEASERALEAAELLEGTFSPKELEQLREAGWEYLVERAAEARRGLEEEEELHARLRPPAAPGELRLFDALASARSDVRSRVSPRPRPQASGGAAAAAGDLSQGMVSPPRLTVSRGSTEEGQVSVHVELQDPLQRGGGPRRPVTVTIALDPFEALRLRPDCTCSPGAPGTCAHALYALDRLLAAIARPGVFPEEEADRVLLQPVVELVEKPRWARALASLDRAALVEERRRERAEEHRLFWQLSPGLGGLELAPWSQQLGKRGDFKKPRPITMERLGRTPELWSLPQDAKVVELLATIPNAARSFTYVRRALRLLAGHPRVFYGEDSERLLSVRVSQVTLLVEEDGRGGIVLSPRLDERELDRAELASLAADAAKSELIVRLDPDAGRCVLIALDTEQRAALTVLSRHGLVFPAEAKDELLRRLPALGRKLPITVPEALAKRPASADERLIFRLEPEEVVLRVDALVRPIPGGPPLIPGEGPHDVLGALGGELVSVRRDLERERARLSTWLGRLELTPNDEAPHLTWVLPLEPALRLVERLRDATRAEGSAPGAIGPEVGVEWPRGQAWRVSRRAHAQDLRVVLTDKKDWFGIEGEVEVDGSKVALGLLLEAARRNRRYVEVREGEWVALEDELAERLSKVRDVIFEERSALQVSTAGVLALEELLASAGQTDTSSRLQELLDEIHRAEEYQPALPEGLLAELRDYQLAGFTWLARLSRWGAGACLADDMGLGKTLQAIAMLLQRRDEGPALVVAPTSVCFNWVRELRRFAPSLRPISYRELGPARDLEDLPPAAGGGGRTLGPGDVLIVSYGLMTLDIESLERVGFATLVLDEAQALKNAATQRARAARRLSASWKLALTGTPVENHLGELWSLFRTISPGLLGSWDQFRDRFATPIERDKDAERKRALARAIRPFILRRTKAEVLAELPPRTEIELQIELSLEERKLYDAVRLAALAELEVLAEQPSAVREAERSGAQPDPREGPGARRFKVLAAITRLRLLACHPALYDETSKLPSAKLARFMELVRALRAEGHRALVFSQFTRHLALVRRALEAEGASYLYLDGATPAHDRERLVDRFQRGEVELFLISLKAGGTGLNLTAADYVIHLDPWWNPAVEDQATDRAHRLGQVRPVTVYRLVARGTIEEGMVALHAEKRELVRELLEGTDAAAKVSTEELVRLIREGGFGAVEEPPEEDDA